jgi:chorismate binding enzyme
MDTNIVIRTLVLRDGRMDLQVGGAVTYDSDPEAEYAAETLAKGRPCWERSGPSWRSGEHGASTVGQREVITGG